MGGGRSAQRARQRAHTKKALEGLRLQFVFEVIAARCRIVDGSLRVDFRGGRSVGVWLTWTYTEPRTVPAAPGEGGAEGFESDLSSREGISGRKANAPCADNR
jgi:hypothetical protein